MRQENQRVVRREDGTFIFYLFLSGADYVVIIEPPAGALKTGQLEIDYVEH